VETRRFDPADHRKFARALASFEASAILAGLPRDIALTYSSVVQHTGPDGESGYLIDDQTIIRDHAVALERLSSSLWHPWVSWRIRVRG
jgi:hypothetical protein